MRVRGWLIVGGDETAMLPETYRGRAVGTLPNAADYPVGAWFVWNPSPVALGQHWGVPVVCIELPLS